VCVECEKREYDVEPARHDDDFKLLITRDDRCDVCDHYRALKQVTRRPPWATVQTAYYGCRANERDAVQHRHVISISVEPKRYRDIPLMFRRVLMKIGWYRWSFSPFSEEEFLAHVKSTKKRRYREAFRTLKGNPLTKRDFYVNSFIKFEKIDVAKSFVKAPRLIQYRPPRYCGELGRYLVPIERRLFGTWNLRRGVDQVVFAKGLNSFQIARRIVAMDRFRDNVFVLLDHSNFDASVTTKWLESEIAAYSALYHDEYLDFMLSAQRYNRGRTTSGLYYQCEARKMSGEYNTSLGDTLINYVLLESWLEGVDHEILVNGDDSVVSMSRVDWMKLADDAIDWFAGYGFTTKIDIVTTLYRVEFCQCQPIQLRPGLWRMVRKPMRVTSRMAYSVGTYEGEAWLRYLTAIGLAELSCSDGVPVLQAAAMHALHHGLGKEPLTLPYHPGILEPFWGRPLAKRIHPIARATFALAFDISEAQQHQMERWYGHCDHGYVAGLVIKPRDITAKFSVGLPRLWRLKLNVLDAGVSDKTVSRVDCRRERDERDDHACPGRSKLEGEIASRMAGG